MRKNHHIQDKELKEAMDLIRRMSYKIWKNIEDIEDLINDIYLKYLIDRPNYPKGKERGCIIRAVWYGGNNFYRKIVGRKKNRIPPIAFSRLKSYIETEPMSFPDTKKNTDDIKIDIRKSMETLTKQEYMVIELVLDGYNNKEIGKIIKLGESRISYLYKSSREKMKQFLIAGEINDI